MRIIIVDDRPFFMWGAIKKLKSMEAIDTIVMLYFHGKLTYRKERDSEIELECKKLGIELVQTDSTLVFRKQLDEYYADKDTLLFVDFNLGDVVDLFDNGIDIIYAKEKKQQEEDFRIWFYTTSGEDNVDKLNRIFDDHTIPVMKFIPQKYILELDYDYICEGILNRNS